jgi:hypothetical protein
MPLEAGEVEGCLTVCLRLIWVGVVGKKQLGNIIMTHLTA